MGEAMISTVKAGDGWLSVAYTKGPAIVAVSSVSKSADGARKMVLGDLRSRQIEVIPGGDDQAIARLAPRILDGDPTVPISHTGSTPFRLAVYEFVRRIPKGKVASYSDVARGIRKPRAQRAVGTTMATHCLTYIVPCHRVVKNDLSPGRFGSDPKMKVVMLESEGVEFADGRVRERHRLAQDK